MKTGHDAIGTDENESGSAKLENGTDALDTAENEYGRAKHKNGIRLPRYGQKQVRARKT
jgi:exonuclease VII small subunit